VTWRLARLIDRWVSLLSLGSMVDVFTDGAFTWAKRPGFGYVATTDGGRQIGEGSGQVPNDGSNNFAAEVAAIFAALVFAVQNGHHAVRVHTDFASMVKHISGRAPSRRAMVLRLRAFIARHPELKVEVLKVSSENPLLKKAHHLARAAVLSGGEFVIPEAA
jgi:ribonuclease HI